VLTETGQSSANTIVTSIKNGGKNMDERIITYLNENVHKIAQFQVRETVIFIDFVNGDYVRISVNANNLLELDFAGANN
jgi:hypothetical protein